MAPVNKTSSVAKTILFAGVIGVLTACQSSFQTPSRESINYRQARFEEVTAMRGYRHCIEEALKLDQKARLNKSAAQYTAAAKMIQTCESDLGANINGIALEERMRAYGLSIQNYLKGGEILSAQKSLDNFRRAFAGKDLYYSDGSSFIETMNALLHDQDSASFGEFSIVNVNQHLKQEMRRQIYWRKN